MVRVYVGKEGREGGREREIGRETRKEGNGGREVRRKWEKMGRQKK